MIPPSIILTNKTAIEASFIGHAMSELKTLRGLMSFQGLNENYRVISPYPGVLLEASKSFSVEAVRVTVNEAVYQREQQRRNLVKIATPHDGRFFVRVGAPTDVEVDSLGHTIRDDTRYYWIDFAANPSAPTVSDQIAFYVPGDKLWKYDDGDLSFYDNVRYMADDAFLQAVSLADYCKYNVVRSFDLSQEVETVLHSTRFVAGYNFLADAISIIYIPDIPIPAGGEVDINGISKSPVNRFIVDLESRTLCWHHALQRWPEIGTYHESTGSMAGDIIGIDCNSEGVWSVVDINTFNFNGSVASAYGVTGTGSDAVYEYQCATSDVVSLGRNSVVLSLPYRSEPVRLTFNPSSSNAILSCNAATTLATSKVVESGYEWYTTSTYSRESGSPESIPLTYSVNNTSSDSFDCSLFTYDLCPGDLSELVVEKSSYSETYQEWIELHVGVSVAGLPTAGYSYIINGKNGFVQKQESVECHIHYCIKSLNEGGICQDSGGARSATKTFSSFMYGSFGSIQNLRCPAQNISLLLGNRKIVDTTWQMQIVGPYGSTFPTWGECVAVWGQSAPWAGEEGVWSVATTQYPKKYPIVDPRTYFNLENMPISLPDMVSVINVSTQTWYVPAVGAVDETTDYDLCVIDGCPDTKTESGIVAVSILDDRWSDGSQGIVIAVKSNSSGETAIYHDGVDKLTDILAALARDGLLKAGEYLFDIGLI